MKRQLQQQVQHIGQPCVASHPHLFAAHLPRIGAAEYAARRRRIAAQMTVGEVAVFQNSAPRVYSEDVTYPYRWDSNLFYLTGFEQPHAAMVLRHDASFTMYVEPRNAQREQWEGYRCGPERVAEYFGANRGYSIEDFDEEEHTATAVDVGLSLALERLIKSPAEQAIMRKSCSNSARAFRHVIENVSQYAGQQEHVLDALFQLQIRLCNSVPSLAYPSIVACGASANILHYTSCDGLLESGKLVLMDAGGSYGGYASDISRTFPVSGTFSDPQQELYGVVLDAQVQCIAACRVGASLASVHQLSRDLLRQGCERLGVFQQSLKDEEKDPLDVLYPHTIGHFLGLDVHDTLSVGKDTEFRSGMVCTVEPGLYVPQGDGRFHSDFWGIGIRIEDDVLITPDGAFPEILTHEAPK